MTSNPSRRRLMGLTIGSTWLIVISAPFASLSLTAIGTDAARIALMGIRLIVATAVIFAAYQMLELARRRREPRTLEEPLLGRRFGLIVAAEFAGCFVVRGLADWANVEMLIPALVLIVVGLHFFPLAVLFRVPRYHVLGVFFVAIPIACMMLFTRDSRLGQAASLVVTPALGCGLAALVVAIAGFREVRRTMSGATA